VTIEPPIDGPVHLSHAPGADQADDLVGTQPGPLERAALSRWAEVYGTRC
jgi:hypothetical protein